MSSIDRNLTAFQALESVQRAVIKIGGDNACQFKKNADRAKNRLEKGLEIVLVISAIRSSKPEFSNFAHESVIPKTADQREQGFNTTSHLIKIADLLSGEPTEDSQQTALEIASRIEEFTLAALKKDLGDSYEGLPDLTNDLKNKVDELRHHIENYDSEIDKIYNVGEDSIIKKSDGTYFSITGFGEILAQNLYFNYFEKEGINVSVVKTDDLHDSAFGENDIEEIEDDRIKREKSVEGVSKAVGGRVNEVLEEVSAPQVLILAGYCPALAVSRGYTELLAAVILSELIKSTGDKIRTALFVEKAVRGVLGINPTLLSDADLAKTIEAINWDLAEALFGADYGADAGVLQSDSIPDLENADADVFVFDPDDLREGKVTHIANHQMKPNGVEIIQPRAGAILEIEYFGPRLRRRDRDHLQGTFKTWANERELTWIDNNSSEKTSTRVLAGPKSQKITQQDIDDLYALFQSKDQLGSNRIRINYNPEVSIIFGLGNNMSKPGIASSVNLALDALDVNRLDLGQVGQQALWFAVDKKQENEIATGLYTLLVNTTPEVFRRMQKEEGGLKSLLKA